MRRRTSSSRSVSGSLVGFSWPGWEISCRTLRAIAGSRDGSPRCHPMDRLHQLLRAGILQEVPEGARLHGREHLVVGGEAGEHQDPDLGMGRRDPAGGLDAVHLGHHQVHEHHVRLQRTGLLHRFQAILGLSHDLDVPFGGQQHGQSLAHDVMVIGDQDPDRFLRSWHRQSISHKCGMRASRGMRPFSDAGDPAARLPWPS